MNSNERRSEPRDVNEILAEIISDLKARKDNANDRPRKSSEERESVRFAGL